MLSSFSLAFNFLNYSAWIPAAKTFGGISLTTTDPAPITELSPILYAARIMQPCVIHTFLPITIGFAFTLQNF